MKQITNTKEDMFIMPASLIKYGNMVTLQNQSIRIKQSQKLPCTRILIRPFQKYWTSHNNRTTRIGGSQGIGYNESEVTGKDQNYYGQNKKSFLQRVQDGCGPAMSLLLAGIVSPGIIKSTLFLQFFAQLLPLGEKTDGMRLFEIFIGREISQTSARKTLKKKCSNLTELFAKGYCFALCHPCIGYLVVLITGILI